MSLLVEDWVSRAAALQRRGRAGRVRPGTCYCCYTRSRFENTMRQYAVPEVARVPLEELVLQIHLLGLGPAASFLPTLIQPPPAKAVEAALIGLQEVGAISILASGEHSNPSSSSSSTAPASAAAAAGVHAAGREVLTPLGRLLAILPLEPRLGKLLVMGAALGCLAPALVSVLSCVWRGCEILLSGMNVWRFRLVYIPAYLLGAWYFLGTCFGDCGV